MIVIFCPRATATGGTELLHQLGYKLRMFGFDAFIYYYGDDDERPDIHPHFLKYDVSRIDELTDSKDNCYVYPEVLASSLKSIKEQLPGSKHVFWWLSVDNASMTPELEEEFRQDTELIHYVQSYYARDYVREVLKVGDDRLFYLSDYINIDFLNIKTGGPRDNTVLFNPRKGYERTSQLIRKSSYRIKWQALSGARPEDIPKILQTAKAYIDFGNHPGKDRFPREAVACGCRIITGRRGSAANDKDIPLDDQLKISDDTDDAVILNIIQWLLDNYEKSGGLYHEYDRMIHEEMHGFEADVLKRFSSLFNKPVKGNDKNRDELKECILESVNNEDYRSAFCYITVYRMNRYPMDTDMMILEGYTRLGLNEEQVALYLMNSLLETDSSNYEAYLIKARALAVLSPDEMNETLDNALKYSRGTDDEEYIADAVKVLRSNKI